MSWLEYLLAGASDTLQPIFAAIFRISARIRFLDRNKLSDRLLISLKRFEFARLGESSSRTGNVTACGNKKNHKFQKAPILRSSFSSDNALYLSFRRRTCFRKFLGKSERRFRRHFPARDIATEDLQRHRDPQSIRSDTSPTRKDKNARASLPQQRAEAAPTGPAPPRRQKEHMGKSADGDARVLLRVQRLGDRVQRCQQHRDHDSPCGRLLRGAIPIPLIKTSSAPAPSVSPQRSASQLTTEGRFRIIPSTRPTRGPSPSLTRNPALF